jgi:opacity protein-like surface antigen
MKKNVFIVVLALVGLVSTVVNAKEGVLTPYAGLQVGYNTIGEDDPDNYVSYGLGAGAKYGIVDGLYVGAEAFYNLGKYKKDGLEEYKTFDVLAKVGYDITNEVAIFANLGLGGYALKGDSTETETAFVYGGGAAYTLNNIQLSLSYNLAKPEFDFGEKGKKEVKIQNVSANVNYLF